MYNKSQTRNKINPEWIQINQNVLLVKFSLKWGTIATKKWPTVKEKLGKS